MDSEGAEIRQQMDDTMAGLTDKLEDLGDQVSGTVKSVKKSMNSVRDAFDVKSQVRRHPLTALAGAAALGFFCGYRPDGNPTRNCRYSARPVARAAPLERPRAGTNDDANGTDAGRSPAATVPSWLANLGETFKPEITALRGVAVGALIEVAREVIMKQMAKPVAPSAGNTNNGSNGTSIHQQGTPR